MDACAGSKQVRTDSVCPLTPSNAGRTSDVPKHQVLEVLLVCVILAGTDQLDSADARLGFGISGKSFGLAEVVLEVGVMGFQNVDDVVQSRVTSDD